MLTEAERGTRMKIDEPKTPYVPYSETDRAADDHEADMADFEGLLLFFVLCNCFFLALDFQLASPMKKKNSIDSVDSSGQRQVGGRRPRVRYGSSGGESGASSGGEGAIAPVFGAPGEDWDDDSDEDSAHPSKSEEGTLFYDFCNHGRFYVCRTKEA